MTTGVRTVIYPVGDLALAKALFSALLGAEPVVDAPYYVQFDVDGQAIGLDPNGHRFGAEQRPEQRLRAGQVVDGVDDGADPGRHDVLLVSRVRVWHLSDTRRPRDVTT